MLTQFAIVSNHDEVIDLGTSSDDRRTNGSAINRRTGTDFCVFVDFNSSQLRDLDESPFGEAISESIRTDDSTTVDNDSITQRRVVIQHRVGINDHILTQATTRSDYNSGINITAGTDNRFIANARSGANVTVLTQGSSRADVSVRRNPSRGSSANLAELRQDSLKGRMRIIDNDQRSTRIGSDTSSDLRIQDNSASLAALQATHMAFVQNERHGIRAGRFDGRSITDHSI